MELHLIMLDDNKVGTFRAPLDILVALKSAWNDALVAFTLVSIVPLEMNFFTNLEKELLTLGVKKRVSQFHQRVAGSSFLN
jgi:hypothetical protein